MAPAAAPEAQGAVPRALRASGAPRVLTAEGLLAAVGCHGYSAVVHAALPSQGIAALAPPLTELSSLVDLDLSGNALRDLSPLAALPSLRRLNAAGNCITLPSELLECPAGAGFRSLERLDLSYNQLAPNVLLLLQHLPCLRELDISGNALQALPALDSSAFPVLHRLAAGHNELAGSALTALASLPLLRQLVLQHNRVGKLPPLPPAAFARLELLDLSHNSLDDVAAVQRLQRLPSIQRLLLAGCPVARAGYGAVGTVAGTLHQARAGAGRHEGSGLASAARSGSRAGKPSLAQTFQFSAVVEEPSAVSLRAKAMARRGSAASSAGSTASMHSSATTSACPTRPGTGGATAESSVPPGVLEAAAAAPATEQMRAGGSTVTEGREAGGEAAAAVPLINWAEDSSSGEEESDGSWQEQCAGWSTGSANGSGSTADDALLTVEGDSNEDPTLSLALALGLDPLLLPAAGGPGLPGNPASAINALRLHLAHPASAPSLSASPAAGGSHHLAMTASMLAKQRRKAGEGVGAGGSLESQRQRVQQIDGLLSAMKRRLRAVQAAMAADLARAQEPEEQQQRGLEQQPQLEAIAEEAGSPRGGGEAPEAQAGEEARAAAGAPPASGGQPALVMSTSGKHTQAHNLLVDVLAGLPAEASRPQSRGAAQPLSPAATSRSGAAQGSPRLKRPSVVATELHVFADTLRERL